MAEQPPIKIIRHANAKVMRLRVSHQKICLTVPKYCTQQQVDRFIKDSEQWIKNTYAQFCNLNLPETLQLFNQDMPVKICIQSQDDLFLLQDETLFLQEKNPRQALQLFIMQYAKLYLPSVFEKISKQTQLEYKKLTIRFAKTRWGSCSQQHHIMLNALLVILPMDVVRYVCVHELVHTVHFNHSRVFWNLVEHLDPAYLQHRKMLHYPTWF